MLTLSILIPVYNEEKTIQELIDKVAQVKLPESIKKEIIIVSDGSSDGTDKILSGLKLKGLKFLRHERNFGKGRAVRTGLKKATGDFIIIQDADLEYNPEDYSRLLKPILEDGVSVVYGSRLINYPLRFWGRNKTVMPFHLIANKSLTWLTNFLYGSNLTDMETCYKLFKKEIFQRITLSSTGFDIEPEITAKILKLKIPISEIPIKVKPRTYKEGKKIDFVDGFLAIWTLIKYRFI